MKTRALIPLTLSVLTLCAAASAPASAGQPSKYLEQSSWTWLLHQLRPQTEAVSGTAVASRRAMKEAEGRSTQYQHEGYEGQRSR